MSLPLQLSNAQDAITLKLIDKNVTSHFQDQKYLNEGDKFLNISIMLRRKISPLFPPINSFDIFVIHALAGKLLYHAWKSKNGFIRVRRDTTVGHMKKKKYDNIPWNFNFYWCLKKNAQIKIWKTPKKNTEKLICLASWLKFPTKKKPQSMRIRNITKWAARN